MADSDHVESPREELKPYGDVAVYSCMSLAIDV